MHKVFVPGKGLTYQVVTNESMNSEPTLKSDFQSQESRSSFRPWAVVTVTNKALSQI